MKNINARVRFLFVSLIISMSISTKANAFASVVFDPAHNLTTLLQLGKDVAAWASDYALQEYNNLSTVATNTAKIAEVLAKLRDTEMSEEAIEKVRDLVKDFTFGVVDPDIDLGDLTINGNLLLEVLTEKLSESMAYKKAVSSRMDDVIGVVKERYPEADELLGSDLQREFFKNGEALGQAQIEESIRGQYDSGAATMRANSSLLEGLADADATLKELRTDFMDADLGQNAMLRRIMKGSLVSAENTRATAEAVTLFTDLQAQQMIKDASYEARDLSKFIGNRVGFDEMREKEINNLKSIKDQNESYWTMKTVK